MSLDIYKGITFFSFLYIITFIPCWILLLFIILAVIKKRYKRLFFLLPIFIFIYLLPFIYLFIILDSINWQLKSVIIGIPLLLLLRFIIIENKKKYFWNIYANIYDVLNKFYPYKILITQLVEEIRKLKKRGKILDLGCGTGNLIKQLAQYNNYEIIGIDFSEIMIKKAEKKLIKFPNTKLINIDIENFDKIFTEEFDLIVINNTLYTTEKPQFILDSISRFLKNDGFFLISEPKRNSSLFKLFLSDYKKRKNIFFYILYFFPLLLLWLCNIIIVIQESDKNYTHFYTKNELTKMLNKYKILDISETYENQNILIKAKKLL
ncbi:MAG: class I SAM-dependent methyltransferase [Patescibacteria group bacterium]|nr:class I SAM-dependent methyltransferase [Patescibacteria group bacterium]